MLCKATEEIPEGFKPVKLELTLQSPEELRLMRGFLCMNATIPHAINTMSLGGPDGRTAYDSTNREVAEFTRRFMDNLRDEINRCLAGKVI